MWDIAGIWDAEALCKMTRMLSRCLTACFRMEQYTTGTLVCSIIMPSVSRSLPACLWFHHVSAVVFGLHYIHQSGLSHFMLLELLPSTCAVLRLLHPEQEVFIGDSHQGNHATAGNRTWSECSLSRAAAGYDMLSARIAKRQNGLFGRTHVSPLSPHLLAVRCGTDSTAKRTRTTSRKFSDTARRYATP